MALEILDRDHPARQYYLPRPEKNINPNTFTTILLCQPPANIPPQPPMRHVQDTKLKQGDPYQAARIPASEARSAAGGRWAAF